MKNIKGVKKYSYFSYSNFKDGFRKILRVTRNIDIFHMTNINNPLTSIYVSIDREHFMVGEKGQPLPQHPERPHTQEWRTNNASQVSSMTINIFLTLKVYPIINYCDSGLPVVNIVVFF